MATRTTPRSSLHKILFLPKGFFRIKCRSEAKGHDRGVMKEQKYRRCLIFKCHLKTLFMTSNPAIYLSYAWGDKNESGESREKIADRLYESLLNDGYRVIRDKESLGYRGSISEFMKEIGRGSLIIVVISDKYLKSPYCMFELLEIFRKSGSEVSEMREKIFPIVLDDAKIYNPAEVVNYVDFWKEKRDELNEKILTVGLANASGMVDDFKIYHEVTSNISLLISLLKDLNSLNPQALSDDNFIGIKNAILASVTGNVPPANPLQKSNGDPEPSYHLPQIRKFLVNALSDADLNSLCLDHFEKVYDSFADTMSKPQKINLLLDHCKRNFKMETLLSAMNEANPDLFERYQPYR